LKDKPKQRVSIGSGTIYQRRGISYQSALDHMARKPENVIFRSIDVGPDRIEIVYSFKTRQKVSAGNGVSGSWRGYFSMGVSDGTLIIDAKTFTPIEHRTKGLTETYSNYTPLDDGHQVPLRIQIDKMNLDWTFKLHPEGLWLFDRNTETESGQEPVAKVTNIVINGKPLKDDRTPRERQLDILDDLIKAREMEAGRLKAQIETLKNDNPDLAKGFERQLELLNQEQERIIETKKKLQEKSE
jgi:hypothetical protein